MSSAVKDSEEGRDGREMIGEILLHCQAASPDRGPAEETAAFTLRFKEKGGLLTGFDFFPCLYQHRHDCPRCSGRTELCDSECGDHGISR